MKDDLKELIENELDSIESIENKDIHKMIEETIQKQNDKAIQDIEYRNKLFGILEKLKKMNIHCDYNDKMSNEELEKIIKEVKI